MWDPHYELSLPWTIIDIITSCVLLGAAVLSIILKRRTVAPDIFGYVSSMTRDNPHLLLPEGGSTLSGVERAKALRKLKVKITDLNEEGEVGRIGLAAADAERHIALSKTKQYV